MSKQQIIEKFDPSRLSKSPSKFDIVKMNWFSKQYFKNISTQNLISKLDIENNEWSTLFVDTFKESCATIDELKHHLNKYLNKDIEPSFDLSTEEKMVVSFFFNLLNSIEFTIENIQLAIEQTKSKLSVTGKKLFMPIRKAATYAEHGPELAKAIYLFGKDCVVKRLKSWN